MGIDFKNPFVQSIHIQGFPIDVLRLDQIHPIVSGNKWYKLKGYINHIIAQQISGFVTFGGAYSNHLHAAALVAKEYKIQAVGVVRGAEFAASKNATLLSCEANGMQLKFVSRSDYSKKESPSFLADLQAQYPKFLLIPEGGSGDLGLVGVADLQQYIDTKYTHVLLASGSGTTLVGLRNVLPRHQKILGFAPMKNGAYLNKTLNAITPEWTIMDNYHFGGFGKYNTTLLQFMNDFYQEHQIPTDIVYTAKMFWGISQMIAQQHWTEQDKILVIHTGGLQGNHAIQDHLLFK
jgi:1-aminocyclopropane-1-carboxylate deaminase